MSALLVASAGCDTGPEDPAPPEAASTTEPAAKPAAEDAAEDAPTQAGKPSAESGEESPEAAAPPGMVDVPGGIYLMGTPEGGSFEERPMHEVIVPALWVDRTEVTHGAYMSCVDAGVCGAPVDDNPYCNVRFDDHDNHPANCVTWNDANAYCEWKGKRLPFEREWEYLARGGAERRTFSWGEEPANKDIACYMHMGTCEVGSYPAGAFGLVDMSGNVWEWTASWYGPYPDELQDGMFKVYRGGSWSRRFPKWLRNELRNRYRPERTSAALGFRCVQTQQPLACPAQTAPAERTSERAPRCERVEGATLCEDGRRFDGEKCVLDLEAALAAGGPSTLTATGASTHPTDAASPSAEVTYVRSRTPQHDSDCQSNWPATPAAYRWDGGTFHSRNPVIAAAGCVKRDMGRDWTSACCVQ